MKPSAKSVYQRLMVLKYVIIHANSNIPKDSLEEIMSNFSQNEKEECKKEIAIFKDATISYMKKNDLWNYTTQNERDFLSSTGTKMDVFEQINASWQIEAAVVLMWALNIIDKFPDVNEQANSEVLKLVEIRKLSFFSNDLSLRPYKEIKRMRDIIQTWHWRVNTRRLIESNFDFQPDESMKKFGINNLDDIVRMTAKDAYSSGNISEIKDEDFVIKGQPFRDLNDEDFSEATSIIMERHHALNWLCGLAPKNNWNDTPVDT